MGQKRKQTKPDAPLSVTTEVTEDHYRIKNWVAREWLPIIGTQATMLYNIYSAAANKERGNSWFFSIRTLEEFTFIDKSTINMANWLLELCGLIRVDTGVDGYANEYVILDPPHATPETLKPIVAALKEPAEVGQKWENFKANVLERIHKWKPLHECGKVSQYKKGMVESQVKARQLGLFGSNGHHPEPTKPSHVELVAMLMKYFEPEKLTEKAAMKMVEQYGVEAVMTQLDWLNDRQSDTPLRTLRAALKGQWAEPKPVGKAQGESSWLSPEEKEVILKNMGQFEEVS